MLDVSRIISGKLQLQPSVVDVCDIVARAADVVRPSADAKNIRLVANDRPDCFVHGDAERLQQVFWNLLSNAVKFTPAGGSVAVEATREGNDVRVSVVDSGVGIAPEFVPFLFDRFRQADQSTTRLYGGLGLGLSIVKHLTELHGGSVSASSEGPGRGARFDVRLPATAPDSRLRSGSPPSHRANLTGKSILVVDDDASSREVVAAALESAHAEVHVVASAAEAKTCLRQHPPDLIVTDLAMPREDGFSLIRDVRRSQPSDLPVIALSAYADHGSREAALAAGFTAFLAKPTRAEALLELVTSLLEG